MMIQTGVQVIGEHSTAHTKHNVSLSRVDWQLSMNLGEHLYTKITTYLYYAHNYDHMTTSNY